MKDRVRVALVLAAGYYLGRRHKLRFAAGLAVAGLAGAMRRSDRGNLLEQGLKALGSSPEIEKLTGRLRGELLEVGKAAAIAATSRQIDSLTEKVQGRSEPPQPTDRPSAAGEEDDTYDTYDEEDEADELPEPRRHARRPKIRRVPSVHSSSREPR
ncbi:hypothetical protein ACWEPC_51140 [Nonomuraea sp. NPDC004297]